METGADTSAGLILHTLAGSWLYSSTDASGIGAPSAIWAFPSLTSTIGARSSRRTSKGIGRRRYHCGISGGRFIRFGSARFWVYASGVFEIILGLGVALPWFRKEAAFGITLMLLVLYWANLNMWLNDIPLDGKTYAGHWHALRGVGQVVLVCISLWLGGFETGQKLSEWVRSRG